MSRTRYEDPLQILEKYKMPGEVQIDIGKRAAKRRKQMKFTQKELSVRSGVSLGSIRRFEQTGEISLNSLLKIAFALNCLDDFSEVFSRRFYKNIQEVIDEINQDS